MPRLTATGLPRDEFCITTKVHPDNFGENRFLASVERSLAALQVDQVDVLLLHWPPIGGNVAPSLRLLQQALDRGLTRNIGVSNYTVAMMNEAVAVVDAPIVTNQVEFHPLLDQSRLLAGACDAGIPSVIVLFDCARPGPEFSRARGDRCILRQVGSSGRAPVDPSERRQRQRDVIESGEYPGQFRHRGLLPQLRRHGEDRKAFETELQDRPGKCLAVGARLGLTNGGSPVRGPAGCHE